MNISILATTDKTAIAISTLCALHCLFTPLLVVMVPSLSTSLLAGELFHKLLVLVVVPLSVFSLFLGCQHHNRHRVLLVGALGIAVLVMTAIWGESLPSHDYEVILTLIGSLIVASAHILNFRLCRACEKCHE